MMSEMLIHPQASQIFILYLAFNNRNTYCTIYPDGGIYS